MGLQNRGAWVFGIIFISLFVFSAWTLGGAAVAFFIGIGLVALAALFLIVWAFIHREVEVISFIKDIFFG